MELTHRMTQLQAVISTGRDIDRKQELGEKTKDQGELITEEGLFGDRLG